MADHKSTYHRVHVERALEKHNIDFGTAYQIVGPCEEIHPKLSGDIRWDWVCRDERSRREAAVEVKLLTDQAGQKTHSDLEKLAAQVKASLSSKLPGVFRLVLSGSLEDSAMTVLERQQFMDAIKKVMLCVAPKLDVNKEVDLTQRLKYMLPHLSGLSFRVEVTKVDGKGSGLEVSLSFGFSGASGRLEGADLQELEKLVRSADRQLAEARNQGASQTFLILLDIGYVAADADAVRETLHSFCREHYHNIDFLYLVGGTSEPGGVPRVERLAMGELGG